MLTLPTLSYFELITPFPLGKVFGLRDPISYFGDYYTKGSMAQRKLTSEFRRLRSDYKSRSGGTKRRSSSFNSSAGNQLLTGDVSSSAWEQVWYFFYLYQLI